MKNYVQQLVELFGHNDYSAVTRKKVQQWLADEEYAAEKREALRVLWEQVNQLVIISCLYGELLLFFYLLFHLYRSI